MMKKKCFEFGLLPGILAWLWMVYYPAAISAKPGAGAEEDKIIIAAAAGEKIIIDGLLEEKTWQTPAIREKFISYQPLYGDELPMETLVWAAYDRENLYFAFQCQDPEPGKIKTSITKRDNMLGDDWVSVSIDAMGSGQNAYIFYVNPNGIQGDSLTTAFHNVDDMAPDFVWDSAARVTDKGYQVEIAIPLKSIKFKSGKEVSMGVLFRRRISRLSYIASWPAIKPIHWILNSQAKIIYKNLKKQFRLEILPVLTYSDDRDRVSPGEWEKSGSGTEFGIGLKYGLTSASVAEVTINPDFSQVESDAFQVEVNQRYPLFYPEKRPFFMEGAEIFNFWTYPYGFFPNAVHTRQIVDPGWGAKLTGGVGKFSFGVLTAGDEAPGNPWESGTNPNEGKSAFFGIMRGKYTLGSRGRYIGFLYNGRDFGDEYNRLFGVDALIWLAKKHEIRTSFIQSLSRDSQGQVSNASDSNYGTVVYTHGTKRVFIGMIFEHNGREFRADSGYLRRNGINEYWLMGTLFFYTDQKKIPWLKLISTDLIFEFLHDLNTHRDDYTGCFNLNFYFTKEADLTLGFYHYRENWQGVPFDMNRLRVGGAIRLLNWLKLEGFFFLRKGIYYYADPAFLGNCFGGSLSLDIQPTNNLNQYLSLTHSDLSKEGKRIYNVDILYSKTTYQFNKYFFLRAVVQYDSYLERLLTDFLASFTLIPGTVIHVGYGGLYENRQWINDQWVPGEGNMLNVRKSFFAKISYLWHF
jgi:hypothetical protein